MLTTMPVVSDTVPKEGKKVPLSEDDLIVLCPHAARTSQSPSVQSESKMADAVNAKLEQNGDPSLTAGDDNSDLLTEGDMVKMSNGHQGTLHGEEFMRQESSYKVDGHEDVGGSQKEQGAKGIGAFSLKLSIPGISEVIDVMMTAHDTVQDLKQFVFDKPESCYRTNLSVSLDGKRLEDFVELSAVEGLVNGSVIKFVEEPYTQRDVRLHLLRMRELLNGYAVQDIFNGSNTELSLSFLSHVVMENIEENAFKGLKSDPKSMASDPSLQVPSFCLPSSGPPPLSNFYPDGVVTKVPKCVRKVSYSQWNPVPRLRKIKGDLIYIEVDTLEERQFCITACSTGFYLNNCTDRRFDPSPQKVPYHSRTMIGLLSQISPLFKKNFGQVLKMNQKKNPYEYISAPYPVVQPWLVPKFDHSAEQVPIEGVLVSRLGMEEQVFSQSREWNQELTQARELPRESDMQRMVRDKSLHRTYTEFMHAAVRGAVNIIEGNVAPLNPSEDKKNHIFLWCNMFFSLAFDNHSVCYQKLGGDPAAHAACSLDVKGIALFDKVDIEGLNTIPTVVIDLKGFRIVVQSLVPGLLMNDAESFVVYGSMGSMEKWRNDDKFAELFKKASELLHLREHKVYGPDNVAISVSTSVECKGIKGTDGRYYAMDLYKLLPEDANYLDESQAKNGDEPSKGDGQREDEGCPEEVDVSAATEHDKHEEESDKCEGQSDKCEGQSDKCEGQSEKSYSDVERRKRKFEHKLTLMRPELVESFIEIQYRRFVASVSKRLQATGNTPSGGSKGDTGGMLFKEERELLTKGVTTAPTVNVDKKSMADDPHMAVTGDPQEGVTGDPQMAVTDDPQMGVAGDSQMGVTGDPQIGVTGDPQTGVAGDPQEGVAGDPQMGMAGDPQEGVAGDPQMGVTGDPQMGVAGDPQMGVTSDPQMGVAGDPQMGMANSVAEPYKKLDTVSPDSGLGSVNLSRVLGQSETNSENVVKTIQESVRLAAESVGSSQMEGFEIKFNPDFFTPDIKLADSEEELERDRKVLTDISMYLIKVVIPQFIIECASMVLALLDGDALTTSMHKHGINMRYLGKIAKLISSNSQLDYVYNLVVMEMVLRAAKRILRKELQSVPLGNASTVIAHILNCFLGKVMSKEIEMSKRKQKKKRRLTSTTLSYECLMSTSSLWEAICKDVDEHFDYKIQLSSCESFCREHGFHRVTLLRGICRKLGLQVILREYNFHDSSIFTEDDIVGFYPLLKHCAPRPREAVLWMEEAELKLANGNLQEALELAMAALTQFSQVYGPIHKDIATCSRILARVHYLADQYALALSHQQRAVYIYERTLGVDHRNTVAAYIHLAIYCHTAELTSAGIRLMYRARYYMKLLYGESHPHIATLDTNLGLMLHSINEYASSLKFLQNSLKIFKKYQDENSIHIAMSHHLVARGLSFQADFRAALKHEKEANQIYEKQLGPNHLHTLESYNCMKQLAEKAVLMQKTINNLTGKPLSQVSSDTKNLEMPGDWGDVMGMIRRVNTGRLHRIKEQVKQ